MPLFPRQLLLTLSLALATVAGAQAQSRPASDAAVLPVWNHASGKLEAVLLLEPTNATIGTRSRFSGGALETAFGLEAGDSLGLLCDREYGLSGALGNLINRCNLAAFDDDLDAAGSRRASAGASLARPDGKFGLSLGSGYDTLPSWLAPSGKSGRVEQNDLSVFAQKHVSNDGFVSIGGTVARARLIPAADVPALADRWNSKSLSVGGGYGAFSGNIVGRVVDVPGQSGQWEGLGFGLTWRTPWSGQLTVGADNLVTRGKNPFATGEDEGTVPYVRYEQDL